MSDSIPALLEPLGKPETGAGYWKFKNVWIPLRDGTRLSANIFLPVPGPGGFEKAPVIVSFSPYGKDIVASQYGLPNTDIYAEMYAKIPGQGPDACFELMDPNLWTKEYRYCIVRVDARGCGRSEGKLDPFGLERTMALGADAEGHDLFDVIEWVGSQPWSSGKVATAGISYYGMIGHWAATQQPPHLAAVLCYEAASDMYQAVRKGGVLSGSFWRHWFRLCVLPYQRKVNNTEMNEQERGESGSNFESIVAQSEYPDESPWSILGKSRDQSNVQVPMYTAGNWTDAELHMPGNILAYNHASSKFKWLEMHSGNHVASFYHPAHVAQQKQFLDFFLKDGVNNGMLDVPRIRLTIRHSDEERNFYRTEAQFPPKDAEPLVFHLEEGRASLGRTTASTASSPCEYSGLNGRVAFVGDPCSKDIEILGTPFLELDVATEAQDLDLFVYLRTLRPDGNAALIVGNHDERIASFCRGFWRLSHRNELSSSTTRLSEMIPKVNYVGAAPVERMKVYSVVVMLCPTSFVLAKGERLQVEIASTDEEGTLPPMRHDGGDRTPERFGGTNFLYPGARLCLPTVQRQSN